MLNSKRNAGHKEPFIPPVRPRPDLAQKDTETSDFLTYSQVRKFVESCVSRNSATENTLKRAFNLPENASNELIENLFSACSHYVDRIVDMWFRIGEKRHEPFDFFHDCIHEAIGDAALEALDIEPENFYPKSVTFPNRNVEADDRIVYDAESDKALLDKYPAAQIYFSEDVIHAEMLAGFWNVLPGIGLRGIFNKKVLYRMARNIMSELDILTSKKKTAFASAAPELISSLRKYNRPNDPVMRHALEILAGQSLDDPNFNPDNLKERISMIDTENPSKMYEIYRALLNYYTTQSGIKTLKRVNVNWVDLYGHRFMHIAHHPLPETDLLFAYFWQHRDQVMDPKSTVFADLFLRIHNGEFDFTKRAIFSDRDIQIMD